MRVLFILHGPHDCQSAVQIFHYANSLVERGWDVAVAAPGDPRRAARVGEAQFEALNFGDLDSAIERWGGPPDLIHTWTPREQVRKITTRLAMRHRVPYVVHMEDPEREVLRYQLNANPDALSAAELDERIGNEQFHPLRGRDFLLGSTGLTLIADALEHYANNAHPWIRLHPILDANRFGDTRKRSATRHRLGILDSEFVVVYPGNLHAANREDIFSLYLSIALLRRRGHPARLIRMGKDYAPHIDASGDHLEANILQMGPTPWAQVPEYLAAGDAFVQPGRLNTFNRERMPAKIPEFLATGKPAVIPACNVGLLARDGEEALLYHEGSATEIADLLESVIEDPERAARIGAAGREFALREFDREKLTDDLEGFYRGAINRFDDNEELRRRVALRGPGAIVPPAAPSPSRRARISRRLARSG